MTGPRQRFGEFGPAFHWSDENVSRLRLMVAEGASASKIAAAFGPGVTRNTIIGKCHRLGLRLNSRNVKPTLNDVQVAPTPAPPPKAPRRAPTPTPVVVVEEAPLPLPAVLPPVDIVLLRDGVTILDLTEFTCRWPEGENPREPATFRYCGAVPVIGYPYCEAHKALAFHQRTEAQS